MLETPDASPVSVAPTAYRLWTPRRVVFTPDALQEPGGQRIYARVASLGIPIEVLKSNRLTELRGSDERDTYRRAKQTLAVVNAPASQFELPPIPPSADYQFHLAQGCPAHCQYCYLAGSLSGPPVVRAYANLPQIQQNLLRFAGTDGVTKSFEASCYTDPLGIEHLIGSLADTIRFFGQQDGMHLRFVTKFDAVDDLLTLPHNGKTRARFSMNADRVSRLFEGGTATVDKRIAALKKMAQAGYPVGVVLAPIMPFDDWQEEYGDLLRCIADALAATPCDLTFELITHRFTPGSRETLLGWYPATSLDMDVEKRERKFGKFGAAKYVYPAATMKEIKAFLTKQIAESLPSARVLYFT
ncbi:MAG: radical SAM protein [Akkermansiaceae bacterium]|nr:radical SAM protein [Armatimonadota bacterium]